MAEPGTILTRTNNKFTTLVGKEGWLYIWGIDDIDAKIQGTQLIAPKELAVIGRNVELRAAWSRDRGIAYRHMVAPDKSAVYPQFLPDTVKRADETILRQCIETWSDPARRIGFIDTLSLLREMAAERQVYFKCDSHWNYVAALAIFNRLADSLVGEHPGMRPFHGEEIATSSVNRVLELAALEDTPYPERSELVRPADPLSKLVWQSQSARGKIQVFEHPDDSLPRAVLFRDSYSSFFLPFLAERCSRLTVLNTRHYWYEFIEIDKPDIVVSQVAERFLQPLTPDLRAHSFYDAFRLPMEDILTAGQRAATIA